jgi:hypothetical protein
VAPGLILLPGQCLWGWRPTLEVSWFLLTHLDSFIVTRQLSSIYRDLVPSRQIILTRDFSTVYLDLQKPRPHLRFASSGHAMLCSFRPPRGKSSRAFTPTRTTDIVQSGGRSATLMLFFAWPLTNLTEKGRTFRLY